MARSVDEALDEPLRRVEEAIEDVEAAFAAFRARIARFRAGLRAGQTVAALMSELPYGERRMIGAALARVQSELRGLRAATVRWMVEREGLSVSDAARIYGVSRQMGSRLYRSVGEEPVKPGRPRRS
jgi:hypothetical protein